jgi:cell pole-organizing protein PopZ
MAPATVQTPLVAAAAQVLAPASASSVDGVRTLEDTVAELLRPMLRQWLDANMPRIVEKALRVELAESAKKKH